MCRWLAYRGSAIVLDRALYAPAHSLIDQSLHSRLGAEATNGDGFGIGWYDEMPTPGLFRSIEPAWNDQNLREVTGHLRSGLFFAHVRAAIGSPVQQSNCHPFRHGTWLFMHNGFIAGFDRLKRDLMLAVDESLFAEIVGSADTEVLFHLALTFGLKEDPPSAIGQAIGFVEDVALRRGVDDAFQGTIATSDGESLWVFRYSSAGKSRSLFFTGHVPTLRRLYPENAILQEVSDETRLVVSEPVGNLPGAWNEVPESSYGIVGPDEEELRRFAVKPPTVSITVPASGAGATTS